MSRRAGFQRTICACVVFVVISALAASLCLADDSEVKSLRAEVNKLRSEIASLRQELSALKEGLKVAAGSEGDPSREAKDEKALRELKELVEKVESTGVPAYITAVETGTAKQRMTVRKIKIDRLSRSDSVLSPYSAYVSLEANLSETDAFAALRDAEDAILPEDSLPVPGYFAVNLSYREGTWRVRSVWQCEENRTIVGEYPPSPSSHRGVAALAKRWYLAFGGQPE